MQIIGASYRVLSCIHMCFTFEEAPYDPAGRGTERVARRSPACIHPSAVAADGLDASGGCFANLPGMTKLGKNTAQKSPEYAIY